MTIEDDKRRMREYRAEHEQVRLRPVEEDGWGIEVVVEETSNGSQWNIISLSSVQVDSLIEKLLTWKKKEGRTP